jgi:hypothetical protein
LRRKLARWHLHGRKRALRPHSCKVGRTETVTTRGHQALVQHNTGTNLGTGKAASQGENLVAAYAPYAPYQVVQVASFQVVQVASSQVVQVASSQAVQVASCPCPCPCPYPYQVVVYQETRGRACGPLFKERLQIVKR